MKHIVERAIVPYNPSVSSIIQKEQYNLFAPIASGNRPGMLKVSLRDFDIKDQVLYLKYTAEDITKLKNEVAVNTSEISANRQKIGALEENIGVLQGGLAAAKGNIQSLETRMNTAEGDIDDLEDRTSVAEGDVDALEDRMSTAEGDVDALEDRMLTAESDIDDLEIRTSVAEGGIDVLKGDVGALKIRMSTAEGDIDALETRVSTTEGDVDALEERMSTAEGKISFSQNDIDKLPHGIKINYTEGSYKFSITFTDADGNDTVTSNEIDLPIESSIVSMSVSGSKLTFTLRNGEQTTLDISTVLRGVVTSLTVNDETKVLSAKTGKLITDAIAQAVSDKITETQLNTILKSYAKTEVLAGYVTEEELNNALEGFQPSTGGGGGTGVSDALKIILDEVFLTNGTHGLRYVISDISAICAGIGTTNSANITIGSKVKGLPVVSIGTGAFSDGTLNSVHIPSSVTTIEAAAFSNNATLKTLYIKKGVTTIKEDAFVYCNSLSIVYYSGTEAEWNTVQISFGNSALENAQKIFNWRE